MHIVKRFLPGARIHLLGFSDYMIDDMLSTGQHWEIRADSIDSAVPLRALDFSIVQPMPKRGDWWASASQIELSKVPSWAIENAMHFQHLIK